MKPVYVIILVIVIAVTAFFGYKVYHRSQLQKSFVHGAGSGQSYHIGNGEGSIPQSGDLCGGTGGNGQIVNLSKDTITIKQKDGRNKIIHLANQVIIKISAGSDSASESDLKTGERITVVGKPNSDGSETANTVVVCNGS